MEIILQHYLSLNRMMFTSLPTKKAVINELIRLSREDGKVPDEATFRNALLRRESLMSTGIGYGLAIP
ncbi:MAG: PTS sugar transporter subunit IIA, partial [Spirochaetota bacterium]